MSNVLTISEVAKILRVSRSTVWRWCRNNTLSSAFRVGRTWRVPESELRKITKGEFTTYFDVEEIDVSSLEFEFRV